MFFFFFVTVALDVISIYIYIFVYKHAHICMRFVLVLGILCRIFSCSVWDAAQKLFDKGEPQAPRTPGYSFWSGEARRTNFGA